MGTPVAAPPGSGQVVRSKGPKDYLLDAARSLAVMAVVIGVLLVVTPARKLVFPGGSAPAVSATEPVAEWHNLTGQAALLPRVPASWRVNAATMTGTSLTTAHLHVGWVTPGQQYLGVDQAGFGGRRLLSVAVGGHTRPAGSVRIGGRAWQVVTDRQGDPVYVGRRGPVTVVVSGSLPPAALRRFAAGLVPSG